MVQISIPETSVTSMEDVAEGIIGLRIAFVNVYGMSHPDGSWTLIDAGLPLSARLIQNWAEKHFSHPPVAIALTHGHFDHVSAARELADHWNIPIFAHPREFPYLTGEREYPPPNFGAGGGLMSLLSPLYPKGPICLGNRLRPFSEQEDAEGSMPGWNVIHSPGHTPGHVSFFRSSDRVLIVGDAFCTTKAESFFDAAITQPAELHGPPAYFTSDWNTATHSIQRLAELNAVVIAPGHGKPLSSNNLSDSLRLFAQKLTDRSSNAGLSN